MKYTHVWFDLGLTLVELNRSQLYKKVLQSFGIEKSEEEIEKAYHKADKIFMRDYKHVLGTEGKTYMPWYLGVVNFNLKVSLDICEVYRVHSEMKGKEVLRWREIEGARVTLKKLKDNGIKVGLISNWDKSCRAVLEKNNILELLDTVIVSSEVGYEKPDKEIFNIAFKEADANPEKSLYVGDNYYDDVIGSSKVGMDCLLINPYGNLGIEEIKYASIISSVNEVVNYI